MGLSGGKLRRLLSVNAEIEQLGACLRCGDCIEEEKDGKKPANFGDTRGFIHLKCEVSKKRPINDVLYCVFV